MRIVRFIESYLSGLPQTQWEPQWGLLVEHGVGAERHQEMSREPSGGRHHLVFPLKAAPYTTYLPDGAQAPKISGEPFHLQELKLLPPVTPTKIVCVGRNYAEHAAELGNEVPSEPLIFLKPTSSLIGPDDQIIYPMISKRVDHEGELAVVIGQRCRNLSESEAPAVIFGYTLANDVTARDLQKSDGQWTRGKGFDTFCPVGPWIDTTFDPAGRQVRCLVNNEVRQDGNTALMIFSLARILAFVTRFTTLEPGDLVLTGTPAGVGPVQPGDTVTVEIEGLGTLSNPVVAEQF